MEQSSSFVQPQSFQLYLLRLKLQLDKLRQNDGEEDAGTEGRRKNCCKILSDSDELVSSSKGPGTLTATGKPGTLTAQDEKKFET